MNQKAKPVVPVSPVKSSSVSGVGYDPGTGTLAVQFKGGKVYYYEGVGPEVKTQLDKAESVGKFVGANVVGKFKHYTVESK